MSEIRLRNATLISAPDTCALDTAAATAVKAVAFANALDGEGLAERARYAQVRRHVARLARGTTARWARQGQRVSASGAFLAGTMRLLCACMCGVATRDTVPHECAVASTQPAHQLSPAPHH